MKVLLAVLPLVLGQLTMPYLQHFLSQAHPPLLVCFYADFHQTDLNHFQYYSQVAQKQFPSLQLGSLLIDEHNIESLNSTYGVDTFQVILFSGPYRLPFDMYHGFYELPSFLKNRQQIVQPINDLTQFMSIRNGLSPVDGLMAILFLPRDSLELLNDYVEITNSFRDLFRCYVVTNKALAMALKGNDQLVLYRNFDQQRVALDEPNKNNMYSFMAMHQHPLLLRVTVANHRYALFDVTLPVLLLVIDRDEDPISQKYVDMLGSVRDTLNTKIQFCYFPLRETTLRTFFNNFLNYELSIGSVVLYNINPEADFPDRYVFHGNVLSQSTLLSFIRQYLQNELVQYRRVQTISQEIQGKVRVLSTLSYSTLENVSTPTLLMLYYSADLEEDLETRYGYLCQHWTHGQIDYARLDLSQNEVKQDLLDKEQKGKVVLVAFLPGGRVYSQVVYDPFRFDDMVVDKLGELSWKGSKQEL